MKICEHYYYDDNDKLYKSLVRQITKHSFECKICKVKLHEVDSQNLNNYIKYLNGNDPFGLLEQKADIFKQLKPIPNEY